jgi:thiamine-phosphate pyrophosphorylase
MASRGKPAERQRPAPQLYLIAPQACTGLAELLGQALNAAAFAAVLVPLGHEGDDASRVSRAKALARGVQEKGAAFLLEGHPHLAAPAGADGAHLEGFEALKAAVTTLKPERIVGCGALRTRDDAMLAGEAGADYVMFGEPGSSGSRPSFEAVTERVAWWAELFEVPCVGFATSIDEVGPLAAAGADFVALGDWVFSDRQRCGSTIADAAVALAGATA